MAESYLGHTELTPWRDRRAPECCLAFSIRIQQYVQSLNYQAFQSFQSLQRLPLHNSLDHESSVQLN